MPALPDLPSPEFSEEEYVTRRTVRKLGVVNKSSCFRTHSSMYIIFLFTQNPTKQCVLVIERDDAFMIPNHVLVILPFFWSKFIHLRAFHAFSVFFLVFRIKNIYYFEFERPDAIH